MLISYPSNSYSVSLPFSMNLQFSRPCGITFEWVKHHFFLLSFPRADSGTPSSSIPVGNISSFSLQLTYRSFRKIFQFFSPKVNLSFQSLLWGYFPRPSLQPSGITHCLDLGSILARRIPALIHCWAPITMFSGSPLFLLAQVLPHPQKGLFSGLTASQSPTFKALPQGLPMKPPCGVHSPEIA